MGRVCQARETGVPTGTNVVASADTPALGMGVSALAKARSCEFRAVHRELDTPYDH